MKKQASLLRPWIWITFLVLFLVAVPWYWDRESEAVFLGFPVWVVISVFVSLLISIFTACVFLTRWPDDEGEDS